MPSYKHPSGKLWSVTLSDLVVEEKWGNPGHPQRSRVHRLATDEEATARYEAILQRLATEGYVRDQESAKGQSPGAAPVRIHRRYEGGPGYLEIILDGVRVAQREGVWDSALVDRDDRETEHASFAAARDAFDRVCGIYALKRGYRLVDEKTGDDVAPLDDTDVVIARDAELELQCRATPDNPAPWSVYADRLIERGDPRGEVAQLHVAGKAAQGDDLVRRRATLLFGSREIAYGARELTYRHGFVVGARLRAKDNTDLAAVTRELLASPMLMFVERLRFGLAGYSRDNDWRPTLEAVIASPVASQIQELAFDDYTYQDCEISWAPYGVFDGLLARLPALAELTIKSGGGGSLGQLALPKLHTLVRVTGGMRVAELASIVDADWPALVRLDLWLGTDMYNGEIVAGSRELEILFAGARMPALRHLALANAQIIEQLIAPLAASALLPQLTSLDLGKGVLARRGVERIIASKDRFAHLVQLDVSQSYLVPAEVAALQAALPATTIIATEQREYEPYEPDDDDEVDEDDLEDDRYVVLGE